MKKVFFSVAMLTSLSLMSQVDKGNVSVKIEKNKTQYIQEVLSNKIEKLRASKSDKKDQKKKLKNMKHERVKQPIREREKPVKKLKIK